MDKKKLVEWLAIIYECCNLTSMLADMPINKAMWSDLHFNVLPFVLLYVLGKVCKTRQYSVVDQVASSQTIYAIQYYRKDFFIVQPA